MDTQRIGLSLSLSLSLSPSLPPSLPHRQDLAVTELIGLGVAEDVDNLPYTCMAYEEEDTWHMRRRIHGVTEDVDNLPRCQCVCVCACVCVCVCLHVYV